MLANGHSMENALAVAEDVAGVAALDRVRDVLQQMRSAIQLADNAQQAVLLVRSATAAEKMLDEALKVCRDLDHEQFELRQEAAEMHLRTQRRAGELLMQMTKHLGGRPPKTPSGQEGVSRPRTLRELGIEVHESHRWQRVASVPADEFETVIADSRRRRQELTTSRVLAAAGRQVRAREVGPDAGQAANESAPFVRRYLSANRHALGVLDLDPATLAEELGRNQRRRQLVYVRRLRAWLEELERRLVALDAAEG